MLSRERAAQLRLNRSRVRAMQGRELLLPLIAIGTAAGWGLRTPPTGAIAMRRLGSSSTTAARTLCVLGDKLASLKLESPPPSFEVGQRVRVTATGVVFRHVPKRKEGLDAHGMVGIVSRIYTEDNLSPNRGIKVEFEDPARWIAHFEPEELELADE